MTIHSFVSRTCFCAWEARSVAEALYLHLNVAFLQWNSHKAFSPRIFPLIVVQSGVWCSTICTTIHRLKPYFQRAELSMKSFAGHTTPEADPDSVVYSPFSRVYLSSHCLSLRNNALERTLEAAPLVLIGQGGSCCFLSPLSRSVLYPGYQILNFPRIWLSASERSTQSHPISDWAYLARLLSYRSSLSAHSVPESDSLCCRFFVFSKNLAVLPEFKFFRTAL